MRRCSHRIPHVYINFTITGLAIQVQHDTCMSEASQQGLPPAPILLKKITVQQKSALGKYLENAGGIS